MDSSLYVNMKVVLVTGLSEVRMSLYPETNLGSGSAGCIAKSAYLLEAALVSSTPKSKDYRNPGTWC